MRSQWHNLSHQMVMFSTVCRGSYKGDIWGFIPSLWFAVWRHSAVHRGLYMLSGGLRHGKGFAFTLRLGPGASFAIEDRTMGPLSGRSVLQMKVFSEGPITQYLRTLAPKNKPLIPFGTRVLQYWVLGPLLLTSECRQSPKSSDIAMRCCSHVPRPWGWRHGLVKFVKLLAVLDPNHTIRLRVSNTRALI